MNRYCLKCCGELEAEEEVCNKCGYKTVIEGVYTEHNKFYCKDCGCDSFAWIDSLNYNNKFVSNFKCKKIKCKNKIRTIHFR